MATAVLPLLACKGLMPDSAAKIGDRRTSQITLGVSAAQQQRPKPVGLGGGDCGERMGAPSTSPALVHQLARVLCECGPRYGAVMVDESAAEAEQQDGTIHVALDESFNPLICVGATVAETEFTTVNMSIRQLYTELTSHSWMADLESFQNFTKDGFHLSNDSIEISNRFVSFLAHAIGFNSFIYFSENFNVSKNKTTLLLYRELIKTVFQKYRSRPLIKLYFEQNQELDRYFARLVAHSLRSVRRPKPEIQVLVRPKMDPPLLSVCDYTMLTFARWYKGYYGCGPQSQSSTDFTWRNFNALRRSISLIRSLEDGTLNRRSLPFTRVL